MNLGWVIFSVMLFISWLVDSRERGGSFLGPVLFIITGAFGLGVLVTSVLI